MRSRSCQSVSTVLGASLSIALACLGGCGGDAFQRGTVSGQVTFDGKPLESGEIVFIPKAPTKGPNAKGVITGGQYSIDIDGPVVGSHRIEIYASRGTGKKIPDMSAKGRTNPQMVEEQFMYIPAQYNDQSTLTTDIAPGPNTADFPLKGPPRR